MVLDTGDIDRDGDEDLLIGSFLLNPTSIDEQLFTKRNDSNKKILILENQHFP